MTRRPRLSRLPSVTALGGGHGLFASLQALRHVTDRLTAVVTVADDGGSSGRLRQEFDVLPPGDLRMALAALCGDDPDGRAWADVLQSRFEGDGPLGGHAIGNLLIAGLWQRLGDPVAGLDMVAQLLSCQGRVLPMSTVPLEIEALVIGSDPALPDEEQTIRGQVNVALTQGEVRLVCLLPPDAPACPEAVTSILTSDAVVLGPGSWFSSVMPHVCLAEQREALIRTPATKILTLNLEPVEETDGFTAARHIEVLAEQAPQLRLDYVVADDQFAGADRHLENYVHSLGAELVIADVAMRDHSMRHDPLRLASVYSELISQR